MKARAVSSIVVASLPEEGQSGDYYTPEYAVNDFAVYPPLGALYVATGVRDHYPTHVLDPVAKRLGIGETVAAILRKRPTIVGLSCQTYRVFPCAEIVRRLKAEDPEIITVIGGPHVTAYPLETFSLPGVDFVVEGDGDSSLRLLAGAISTGDERMLEAIPGLIYRKNGQIERNRVANNPNLDSIPIPDRSMIDMTDYYTAADGTSEVVSMVSSRGCPFKCVYCDVLEKHYRVRSPGNVVDEMQLISERFSNPVIHIFDDTYNLTKKRVMGISEEILRRGLRVKWTTRARVSPFDEEMVSLMARSGLKRAHFGVESGSPLSLQRIKKGVRIEHIENAFALCKKYGVESLAYFIVGFDWETKKELRETVEFIRRISPDFIMANMLHPLAKTQVYEELLKNGAFKTDHWLEQARSPVRDFRLPPHRNAKTRKYLRRVLDEVYISFYLSPRFVLSNLANKRQADSERDWIKSAKELLFKVRLGLTMLYSWCRNRVIEALDPGECEIQEAPRVEEDPARMANA